MNFFIIGLLIVVVKINKGFVKIIVIIVCVFWEVVCFFVMVILMVKVIFWISMVMKILLIFSKKIKIGDFKVVVFFKGEGFVVFKKMLIIIRVLIM